MSEHRGGHPDCAECTDIRLAEMNREPDRLWPDLFKPPRYKWTTTGMVLDSNGPYVMAHMVPAAIENEQRYSSVDLLPGLRMLGLNARQRRDFFTAVTDAIKGRARSPEKTT